MNVAVYTVQDEITTSQPISEVGLPLGRITRTFPNPVAVSALLNLEPEASNPTIENNLFQCVIH